VLVAGCGRGVLAPEGELLRDVFVRGSPSVPTVALTFDDGPNGRCTEAVLDVLRDAAVPATFFVLGRNVTTGRNDALLARMVREGHTIGLHSDQHSVRRLFFRDLTRDDLRTTRLAVEAALARAGIADPPPITLFRPPFGFLTEAAVRGATDAGFHIVEWTVSVGDWQAGRSAADVAEAVMSRVRPGDVIVLHDGNREHQRSLERCRDRQNAAEAVRLLLPALGARGLRPAPLAAVLGITLTASAADH
jgi:peptidoglycan/xylan/chitin deacetylase (PgdA/CDA1 family)